LWECLATVSGSIKAFVWAGKFLLNLHAGCASNSLWTLGTNSLLFLTMSEQVFGFTLSQYSTPILRTLLRFANVHFQEYLDKSSLFSLLMYFESMLNDDECIRLTQVLRAAVRSGAEKNLYKVKVEFRNLALDDKGQKSAGQKQSQKKPGQESNVIRPRTQIHIRSVERSMPRSMRECPVCNEFLPESFFAWRKITKSCRHPPEFCLRCLQKAISAQLDERSFNKLTCPHIACRELLQGGYVEMWATPDTFDR
jgi:hypothetical protein